MRGNLGITAVLTIMLVLAASPVPAQMVILSKSDIDSEVGHDDLVRALMRQSLIDAGYEADWRLEELREGEEGLELIFQVIETDQGFDATFVLTELYHDPEIGLLRGRPVILYQSHAYRSVHEIAEVATEDFIQRLDDEKLLAEEDPEEG